jgi:hypothetical protein
MRNVRPTRFRQLQTSRFMHLVTSSTRPSIRDFAERILWNVRRWVVYSTLMLAAPTTPLFSFFGQEPAVGGGRARKRLAAELGNARLGLRIG